MLRERTPTWTLRRALSRQLMVVLCAFTSSMAWALPTALRQGSDSWAEQGRGEMRWFGLRLYVAELWVPGAPNAGAMPTQGFALRLNYTRSFSSEMLVDSSIDELRRIGVRDEALLSRWRPELLRVLPAVQAGDSLSGVYLPGQGARFYMGEKPIGEITDVELARRFFGIWLDPATREPALRKRLLGLVP